MLKKVTGHQLAHTLTPGDHILVQVQFNGTRNGLALLRAAELELPVPIYDPAGPQSSWGDQRVIVFDAGQRFPDAELAAPAPRLPRMASPRPRCPAWIIRPANRARRRTWTITGRTTRAARSWR